MSTAQEANPAGVLFFEQKIRPLFVKNCYECHSADAKRVRGSLRLDTKKGLLEGGDTGPALVPGKPKESLLLKVLRHEGDVKMPPKGKLSDDEIAAFERWVQMGAPDPRDGKTAVAKKYVNLDEGRKFWAFQPPKKTSPPKVKDAAWPRGPIDQFILSNLENKELKPAGDAKREVLLRRAAFALTGLPPTPDEIDAYVNDAGSEDEAIAKVVDRLLASPHFGERWGRHWLDVARYADSSGGGRTLLFKDAWRYRDYVIQSLNDDKAFNQFILEQIAGDLLDPKTPAQRRAYLIATAFLLLGPTNYERQDKPLLEMDIIDEQIDTIGKGFLGMTIGCARCHDHKFDPIPTKDYYALTGIFKSTKFIIHDNVSKWMTQPLPMPSQEEIALQKHEAVVAALKKRIALAKEAERKAGKLVDVVAKALDPKELPGIVLDDSQAKKVGSWKHSTFSGNFIGTGYLYDDRGFKEEKTLTFVPDFAKTGFFEVRLAYVPHTNRATKVPIRVFHADGDETVYVNQQKPPPIDGRFVSLGRYRFEPGNQWFVMISSEKTNGHVVADAVQFLPDDVEAKPAVAERTKKDKLPADADSQALEAELKRLEKTGPSRHTAMAVADAEKIDDFYVCVRGNVHNKGETAPRGFLQVATRGPMPKLSAKESGRRELAHWIASADNPLTARVFVNRVWQHLFGAGIVRTVDNFGVAGELPSHPELLDYLAVRFVEDGWSVKKLIREIMLSRAYRMSAEPDANTPVLALKLDPENRWLWKMNRRRLDAESIRDAILTVSGKLDLAAGGPSIKEGTATERDYQFTDTRRSLYTPIFRNRLLELFEVFDFADPNVSTGKRNVSTVAPQALYFLNSPFVMEQARHAAQTALSMKADDAACIDRAYRVALGRLPAPKERQLALEFLQGSQGGPGQRLAVWERFYQTLFACIDFRYVN
ncbi:MAG: DUF1553 domain-containing protein [Gemmataceae bacterium]|nr:DUF1553 domain-containing protein [Gemmataceae bacterium]MCI0742664.1 DUF1553 domain-containing protein [Gemmataceae bacterium]